MGSLEKSRMSGSVLLGALPGWAIIVNASPKASPKTILEVRFVFIVGGSHRIQYDYDYDDDDEDGSGKAQNRPVITTY
jgi:hypothetical protein